MRVVDAEEFEPPLAEFPHQAHDLLERNHVIPSRDVLRRERLRDYVVLRLWFAKLRPTSK